MLHDTALTVSLTVPNGLTGLVLKFKDLETANTSDQPCQLAGP